MLGYCRNRMTSEKPAPLQDLDVAAIVGRLLTGNVAVGIAYVDKAAFVRFANPAFQEFLFSGGGLFRPDQPVMDLLAPERWQTLQPFFDTALAGTPVSLEFPSGGPAASAVLQISLLPDQASDGSAQGFVAVIEDMTRSRQTETALQESEATLRAVFASASQAIVAVDNAGRIQFHNRMAEVIFGYGAGELDGQPIENLMPAAFRERHAVHREKYFQSPRVRGMGLGIELAARRKDGSEFPVEVSLSHVDRGSRPPLAIAFVSDVTRRKQLEQERNQFFNLSADLNCIAGLDGYFKQINQSFQRLLGWSDEEMLSRRFVEFVHPEDRPAVEANLEGLAAGRAVEQFVTRYRCKDGSYRWLSWTAPAPDAGQSLVYASGRDVTSARQAEAERQRLITLIENSTDWIALVSPGGRFQFLNAAGCELAGFASVEQARSAVLDDLFDPADLRSAVNAGERWRGEVSLRNRQTGEAVPLDLNAFAVQSGDDPVWALVARDIRRRKRDQERLQALAAQLLTVQEEERRRIARELHDDLTQKLAMLGIEFGLIHRDVAEANATGERKLMALHEQILQLSEDVRQLSHQLHPSVLEHSGLGPALEAYCREMAKQSGIQIKVATRDLPRTLPQAVGIGLYRIAQEAVRNVCKHSRARSASVTLSGGGQAVRLAVIDDGCGYDSSGLESQRGIGLVGMQERARLIDGKLTIESQPGEGTSVVVEVGLPASAGA